MLFSVVIPTHDRLHLLTQALASVRRQRFCDFEVIVVDDGSTDGTAEALAAEPVRLVSQRHSGASAARNAGAAIARGRYLAFLDSDDLWFPWTLEVFARLLADHGWPALLAGRYLDFDDASDPPAVPEEPAAAAAYRDYLASSHDACFAGAGMWAIARDAFLAAGGFSTGMTCGEDHDLALRLGTASGFVQVLAPVTVAHRRHAGSAMADGARVFQGLKRLLAEESKGRYPGGRARAAARRTILCLHARPVALQRLETRDYPSATWIYLNTFWWHVRDRRVRFLAGFPLLLLRALVVPRPR